MTTNAPPSPAGPIALELADEAATTALAKGLARCLQPGMVIGLSGDLGVGKTTLVRALLAALGHEGRVRSPTFTLLEPYNELKIPIYHFDFYRLSSPKEWRYAGLQDYFGQEGVCLVEWPERAGTDLPTPDLLLTLAFAQSTAAEDARRLSVAAHSTAGQQCLKALCDGHF